VTLKASARGPVIAARTLMDGESRERARAAVRRHVLDRCLADRLPRGRRVAGYEPLRTEPGSAELLDALDDLGYEVIVPITLPDRDLDWQVRRAGGALGAPLGPGAIAAAALILVPAFAVDGEGNRLGRGGGSYDRALARAAAGVPIAALLFEDELVPSVPVDEWDRPVTAAVTPSGWHELG
jgi:5-formyltetrahydrofolate cyclo-ligase